MSSLGTFSTYFFTLKPLGHLGFVPLTFLVVLPLKQTIVFLVTTGLGVTAAPVKTIVAFTETGAKVEVPTCDAVITQFPALSKLSIDPEIVQFSVDVLVKETTPPLDADALRVKLLLEISAVATGEKVIVCGSLVTSNETLYRSDARYEAFGSLW